MPANFSGTDLILDANSHMSLNAVYLDAWYHLSSASAAVSAGLLLTCWLLFPHCNYFVYLTSGGWIFCWILRLNIMHLELLYE